jgi:hypothetical protein
VFAFSLGSSIVLAQFVGVITYNESYKSKDPLISSDDFTKMMGSVRKLYIKGSNYRNVFDGNPGTVLLYRGDRQKIYRFEQNADTVFWMNALSDTLSKIITYKIEDTNETIMHLTVQKLTIKSEMGLTTYFYSGKYGINPADFTRHNLNFWNFYTLKSRAVPLKIVIENDRIIMTSTAVKIESLDLDQIIFDIPFKPLRKLF